MKKQGIKSLFVGFFFCLVFVNVSFAVDIPTDLVEKNDFLSGNSGAAITAAKAQISNLIAYLNDFKNSLPADATDKRTFVENTITRLETRKDNLLSIDVYFAKDSVKYEDIYNYYDGKLSPFRDIDNDQFKEMVSGFSNFPGGPAIGIADEYKEIVKEHGDSSDIPPEFQQAWDKLKDHIDNDEAKAAAGASGNKRVSILNFYLKPPTSSGGAYTFIHRTTLVIATESPTP